MLQCACTRGASDVAAYAISLGARVQGEDAAGDAPLALAARSGHTSSVELLLDSGADIDAINKVSLLSFCDPGKCLTLGSCRFVDNNKFPTIQIQMRKYSTGH